MPRFDLRLVGVGFVMDEEVLAQVYLRVLRGHYHFYKVNLIRHRR
jgi:hypothetical protein